MFVKLLKTATISYIIRRGLKETDLFVTQKGSRDSSFYLCQICGQNSPASISRVESTNPNCPACNEKVQDSNINHTFINQLVAIEQLDFSF